MQRAKTPITISAISLVISDFFLIKVSCDSSRESHKKCSNNSAASSEIETAKFLALWYFCQSRLETKSSTSSFKFETVIILT